MKNKNCIDEVGRRKFRWADGEVGRDWNEGRWWNRLFLFREFHKDRFLILFVLGLYGNYFEPDFKVWGIDNRWMYSMFYGFHLERGWFGCEHFSFDRKFLQFFKKSFRKNLNLPPKNFLFMQKLFLDTSQISETGKDSSGPHFF